MNKFTPLLALGLAACNPGEDTGPVDTQYLPQDTQETAPPVETGDTADTEDTFIKDTDDTADTGDINPADICEISLTRNEDLSTVDWEISECDFEEVVLTVNYYDEIVTRTLNSSEAEGSLNLLPHKLEGHTLQTEFGTTFDLHVAATATDGTVSEETHEFDFFEIDWGVKNVLPITIDFDATVLANISTKTDFENALEDQLFVRVVVMRGGSSYTHFVVVHDALATPVKLFPIDDDMVDSATAERLGFAMLTGADIHNGYAYAMIDTFPNFQIGTTLIMNTTTGELESYIQTPEDHMLNHRFSVRDGNLPEEVIMDTLEWYLTDESDSNMAVEASFTVDSPPTEIDDISTWANPLDITTSTGRLYCNATAPSEEWQVVTCPMTYGAYSSGDGHPENEFILAKHFTTDETMIFYRDGYEHHFVDGFEDQFDYVIKLPDHPSYDEPLLSFVHDAKIEGDQLHIYALQIDSTTDQPSSTYMVNFDATTGTSEFKCEYGNDWMVTNYGNLVLPPGSPFIGMYIPNSGGLRWLDKETCELVGEQRATEDWKETYGDWVLHEKWLESATTQDFEPDQLDSGITYNLDHFTS
jgi:hypothetical protein